MKQVDHADTFAYLLRVCGADLPEPEREYYFARPRKYRADFAWPQARLICEIDGGQFALHGGRHNTDADRDKLNTAACLGWRVLRFSPKQLKEDGFQCVLIVRHALTGDQS